MNCPPIHWCTLKKYRLQAGHMHCPRTPRAKARAAPGPVGSQAMVASQSYALYGFQWSISSSCFNAWCFVVPGLLLHLQKPGGFQHRGQWAVENPARDSTEPPRQSPDQGVHCCGEPSSFTLRGCRNHQELPQQSFIDWAT